MNEIKILLESVSWPYRFLVLLSGFIISIIITSYRMYKKQQLQLEKSRFPNNVMKIVKVIQPKLIELINCLNECWKQQQYDKAKTVSKILIPPMENSVKKLIERVLLSESIISKNMAELIEKRYEDITESLFIYDEKSTHKNLFNLLNDIKIFETTLQQIYPKKFTSKRRINNEV
ncbi:MAG: hypothetical protein PVH77_12035 [Phycisphaerales bacterium]